MRYGRKTGAIVAGSGLLLLAIAAFSFEPLVRAKMASVAERRGLTVTAGSVSPGLFALTVHDLHVELEGTSAVAVDIPDLRVDVTLFGKPTALTAHSSHVALHGTEAEVGDALKAWRERHPHGASSDATAKTPLSLSLDGMGVDWDDRASATGVSVTRDETGTHLAAEHATAKRGEFSVELASARADVNADGMLKAADVANADLTWTSAAAPPKGAAATTPGSGTSPNEPAPPPLPLAQAAKKKRDAKGATPPPTPSASSGPSIALPDLHALRGRATKAASALAAKLADDAQVSVESLLVHHVTLGSKVPELTLGPAKITALRHEHTLDVSFATAANASSTSLKIDAQVPIEHGDLRVVFDGGPLTLAELGAREGAGGLADVGRATVTAKGSAVLADDASKLTVDARFGVANLGIAHPKISDETVHGITASMVLKASLDDHGALTIDDAEGALGALRLRFRGSVVDANDHLEGTLAFDAPTAACQSLLESIPAALIPDVRGTELTGTLGASGRVGFDTRDLDDLDLAYIVDDKCKFAGVPDDFGRERFTHPFSHVVYLPEGDTAEEETGPGSDAWTGLERISPYMQVAVLTTEDGGFYKHHGFNRSAIRNALVADLKAGRFLRGASTISMQTSKNLFLSREKTVSRKLEELILTDYLEQTFSKHEIMELYLNIIEFGPDIYGIKAAADHYFGRTPEDLDFAEALFLSSLLPNPIGYHKLWEKGQISQSWARNIKTLMGLSFKYGKITKEQLDQGLAEDIIFFKEDPNHPELRPAPRPLPVGVKVSGDEPYDDETFKPTDSF